MKTQGKAAPGATVSAKGSGLAYKVGLGVMAVGVLFVASSWPLGRIVFAALSALLTLLGAPEGRRLLPPNEPEAGGQLLQFFGVVLIVCGACIVSFRLVCELLGLAGSSKLTARLRGAEKLGTGAAAIGFLAVVSTGLSQVVLSEVFLYEHGVGAAMYSLEMAGYAGAVALFGGIAVLILGGATCRRVLLGWTDRVGWGKLGYGWINKLGVGLIVLGLAGATLGFEDPTTIVAAAGIGILLVGIVPHILAGGRP